MTKQLNSNCTNQTRVSSFSIDHKHFILYCNLYYYFRMKLIIYVNIIRARMFWFRACLNRLKRDEVKFTQFQNIKYIKVFAVVKAVDKYGHEILIRGYLTKEKFQVDQMFEIRPNSFQGICVCCSKWRNAQNKSYLVRKRLLSFR